MTEQYKLVAENPQSTVVSDYEVKYRGGRQWQSEAELEREFIKQLEAQAYEYLSIGSEEELVRNLRRRLENLNNIKFSDSEWQAFFSATIARPNTGIEEKTRIIQEDHVQVMKRDDGSVKNIYLIDKENVHNNSLQVINQYVPQGGSHENRYDVTILVNGLPLVHVELKRRGVDIRDAFNQIDRYQRESFWSGCGLFEYVQIFVISNGTQTKYYSNTTRATHADQVRKHAGSKSFTSNSFEFTSFWAKRNNQILPDIVDFTATFFSKHTLLNVLTKYCVFTSEKLLLVMRPYQIAATESILQRIRVSANYKTFGKVEAGGYIWHTTGSGKTLTSFKTARLASRLEGVDKVLFVVDRKDLDYQTMKEYDRFEKGAANSNTNTAILKRQLEDDSVRIIITTIQKLSVFIAKNRTHEVYGKHIVMIFDECHRSQFGDMHQAIVKKFKKYHLFGFTGTPIMTDNTPGVNKFLLATTEQVFGECLHSYTIVNAITDGNVLPFRVDYISTMKEQEKISQELVSAIDREKALLAPERISKVVSYILEHFAIKTKRNARSYDFRKLTNISEVASHRKGAEEIKVKTRMTGFNSIFAVSSIEAAKLYYSEFKRQMALLAPERRLSVATIFSWSPNEAQEDFAGGFDDENSESTEGLDRSSRDFLEAAIADYNAMFKTNYDTSSEKFQNYYKDVSLRMKNREIDILIVVNMFLTGFDATTLNTLWVDKNLRMHGLLQAYSRTNRILNSVKTFGNIVCFRDLEAATNEAIARFGDASTGPGLVLLRTFDDYYYGFNDQDGKHQKGYKELVDELMEGWPLGEPIIGEESEKKFIRLYGTILKATNLLSTFDQFEGKEILSPRDVQDYHSLYIDLYEKYRRGRAGEKVDITDDIVFEMELIKHVEINIDYILYLIEQMHGEHGKDVEIRISIQKAISSSPDLRNKKELVEDFIDRMTPDKGVRDDWAEFVRQQRREQLDEIISSENLKPAQTYSFMNQAFKDGAVQESGTGVAAILPPMSIFDKGRESKKKTVLEKLKAFFDRFFDITSGEL